MNRIETTSIYPGEIEVFERSPGLVELVGHYESSAPKSAAFVKTHGTPEDDDPAIYVIRDGRAAIVSYFHYIRNLQDSSVTLERVIRGDVWGGSWSDHVRRWNPLHRPNTLLLYYENLISDLPAECARLAVFLDRELLDVPTHLDFDGLRALNPIFFPSGDNEERFREIFPHMELFESIHGPTMAALGYH
jgi:hypothetical protein